MKEKIKILTVPPGSIVIYRNYMLTL